MLSRCKLVALLLASATVVTSACRAGGSDRAQTGSPQAGGAQGEAAGAVQVATAAGIPVRTAARPPNGCGWIPAAEVEAVLGRLAGPPTPVVSLDNPVPRETGEVCRYDLVVPDSVLAERRKEEQRMQEVKAKLRELQRRLGDTDTSDDASKPGEEEEADAVLVEVEPNGSMVAERALGAAAEIMAGWMGPDTAADSTAAPPKRPDGWDYTGLPLPGHSGFGARIGHVAVSVTSLRLGFPREKTKALAAKVRDALPDLPFARVHHGAPHPPPPSPDPCGLLSRADAEAVLGPLLVAPYRSAEESPLADAGGPSCAYYTAGHHALVVTPHWDGGKREIQLERGIGGLIGAVARDREAEGADTLEGPWDDVAANGHTATLYFLKGDRLLEVGYGVASVGPAEVLRLARAALGRL